MFITKRELMLWHGLIRMTLTCQVLAGRVVAALLMAIWVALVDRPVSTYTEDKIMPRSPIIDLGNRLRGAA